MADNLHEEPADFRFLRTVKVGTFHIGSSAVDLLATGIWNRVMIVDLGMAAWPVALLSALHLDWARARACLAAAASALNRANR
jgi:hypothetical protein